MHMAKSSFWISFLGLISCITYCSAAIAQSGGEPGAFLRLGMGTRALSMGSAFTGVSDDGSASYWNPAGFGLGSRSRHVSIMSRRMPLDRNQLAVTYSQGLEPGGGLAFAWIRYGVDNIDARDLNGQPQGIISDSENALLMSFSPKLHDRVAVGLTMKVLLYKLAGQTAKGFGGDVGLLINPIDPLRIGFLFRDIGTRVSWDTAGLFPQTIQRKETFPRSFTAGASYSLLEGRVLLAADLEAIQRIGSEYRVGAEVSAARGLHLRAGLNDGQVAAGFGFQTAMKSTRQQLHYVFLTDRIGLNETHVFEWEIGF